jgi:glucan phosphoethanolaminetransferase (alkaline phosphatase superfamily)
MSEQNFKNHARYIILWHFVTSGLIVAVLIGSIVNLYNSSRENLYSASLLVVISLILVSVFIFARSFALRVQDRAIRAEENFRHFVLTGKPFDKQLRMGQIIALRFASDAEMPSLALKAVTEKLRSRQIKEAIQHWRPDHYRA